MCGILFTKSNKHFSRKDFEQALDAQAWRGPDAKGTSFESKGISLGHVRLSILDLSASSNQPMSSSSDGGRYKIIYNGEIYNHLDIRKNLGLNCKTSSDTETILEGFSQIGTKVFEMLDGMFALVIYDTLSNNWWAARDRYGIKPLFKYASNDEIIISSETVSIRHLVDCTISENSMREWRLIRRPIPGATFFNEIDEILPGSVLSNNKLLFKMRPASLLEDEKFSQEKIEKMISESVQDHELSDVKNVCLLSGGIDSSLITAISSAKQTYTVGLKENNEIAEAEETATLLEKKIYSLIVEPEELTMSWESLIQLRGEPLSVPNEGLIYLICKSMDTDEKVVLTGEGADEIFFGYDRIFRKGTETGFHFGLSDFYKYYAYAENDNPSERLDDFLSKMMRGRTSIEFLEDFFLEVHLTGLLRRMDMSSMAASKEARVPFVSSKLINYMYRRPSKFKIDKNLSKIPLRVMCESLGLNEPLNRKKVGFSSTMKGVTDRFDEYRNFRKFNLEVLQWL